MHGLAFDIAHVLAGGLVLVSFLMLYQDRMYALINVFALHAVLLAMSVAWQARVQDAPHLYITAMIALIFKATIIPAALRRIVERLDIHRETAIGKLLQGECDPPRNANEILVLESRRMTAPPI